MFIKLFIKKSFLFTAKQRSDNKQVAVCCYLEINSVALYKVDRLVIHCAYLRSTCDDFFLLLSEVILHLDKVGKAEAVGSLSAVKLASGRDVFNILSSL